MHKKIIILVVAFILLANSAGAVKLTTAAAGKLSGLMNILGSLCDLGVIPGKVGKVGFYLEEFTTYFAGVLTRVVLFGFMFFMIEDEDMFYNNIEEGVLSNPSLSPGVENVMGIFIGLLQPIYILAIVLTALYILFMQSSIEGRAKAKSLLSKLIISLAVISLSLPILTASIAISESLTDTILTLVDLEMIEEILHDGIYGSWCLMTRIGIVHSELALAFYSILFSLGMWGPYMVIGLRHIMLVFLFMLFPISITLYSFSLSRGIGRRMLELTIVFLFIQVFMAVTILAISIGTYINPDDIPGLQVPERSCVPPLMPVLGQVFYFIGEGKTDAMSFLIGTVGHILFMIAPLMALRWFKGFLP